MGAVVGHPRLFGCAVLSEVMFHVKYVFCHAESAESAESQSDVKPASGRFPIIQRILREKKAYFCALNRDEK